MNGTMVRLQLNIFLGTVVPLYSFLYSGECSFYNQTSFTNNSYIPSNRKFFHKKPSERYHQARVFMLRWKETNEL